MSLSEGSRLRLAPPVTWGGRLFVPLVRTLSISHQNGGVWLSTPVALLIGERGAWWFVSLDPGTTRECLAELELPPVPKCPE